MPAHERPDEQPDPLADLYSKWRRLAEAWLRAIGHTPRREGDRRLWDKRRPPWLRPRVETANVGFPTRPRWDAPSRRLRTATEQLADAAEHAGIDSESLQRFASELRHSESRRAVKQSALRASAGVPTLEQLLAYEEAELVVTRLRGRSRVRASRQPQKPLSGDNSRILTDIENAVLAQLVKALPDGLRSRDLCEPRSSSHVRGLPNSKAAFRALDCLRSRDFACLAEGTKTWFATEQGQDQIGQS